MPTYLLHGFRWHRSAIRIHIALHNLDDAAAEWVVAPATSVTLLNSFYTLYDFLPPSCPPLSPSLSQAGTLSQSNTNRNSGNRGSVLGGGSGELCPTAGRSESGRATDTESSSGVSRGARSSFDGVAVGRGVGMVKNNEPYPVVKPHYVPLLPNNDFTTGKDNDYGAAAVSESKTLSKKNTKSMGSLRGFGRRKERPPDLPEVPVGGFNRSNGKHSTGGNRNGTTLIADRKTSVSHSVKRASTETSETDQSRTGTKEKETRKKPAFNDWSVVKLVEQYDPSETRCASQPYAYVADYVVEVGLGISMAEEQEKYEAKVREDTQSVPQTPRTPATPLTGKRDSLMRLGSGGSGELSAREMRKKSRRLNWLEKLRDQLQKGEEVGWFVVVCGDEERISSVAGSEDELGRMSTPKSPGGIRRLWSKRNTPVRTSTEYA